MDSQTHMDANIGGHCSQKLTGFQPEISNAFNFTLYHYIRIHFAILSIANLS